MPPRCSRALCGRHKKSGHPILEAWADEGRLVAACPEMLGGLSTPREPAEIAGDNTSRKVITRNGRDVTYAFESGARIVAEHVAYDDVRVAILKNGSPSCGSSFVYDGTFSKRSLPGEGITTALLRSRGVVVFSEDQIDAAADFVDELERGS